MRSPETRSGVTGPVRKFYARIIILEFEASFALMILSLLIACATLLAAVALSAISQRSPVLRAQWAGQ
jgi:hypothetical protein